MKRVLQAITLGAIVSGGLATADEVRCIVAAGPAFVEPAKSKIIVQIDDKTLTSADEAGELAVTGGNGVISIRDFLSDAQLIEKICHLSSSGAKAAFYPGKWTEQNSRSIRFNDKHVFRSPTHVLAYVGDGYAGHCKADTEGNTLRIIRCP